MGWRFRHSFKVIPGVRLNLSRSGLSASIGGAPFTVNVGPRGTYATASLPGSGISFRQKLGGGTEPNAAHRPSLPDGQHEGSSAIPEFTNPTPILTHVVAPIEEIRSASTELLTSASLQEFKRLIQTTYEERDDIERQLAAARSESTRASERYWPWEQGFLFKRLFKKSFAERKANADIALSKVQELEEQLRLTILAAHFDIEKEQAEPYFRMRDEFAALCECGAIWDKKARQATDRVKERTIAVEKIFRERVQFVLGSCDLIQWEQKVPHLRNANGGDLFLYPGFILYRAAKEAFSVIDFHDIILTGCIAPFVEEQGVPKDSQVIGQTWAKCNKDGSRDKRFANNYQIPIAQYAELKLKSQTGLWEEYQVSNPENANRFLKAWHAFGACFSTQQVPQQSR